MGPVISVFLGLVCAEVIFALVLRFVTPVLPVSARWKARFWRWTLALAVVYALMMIIVMLTMNSPSQACDAALSGLAGLGFVMVCDELRDDLGRYFKPIVLLGTYSA